MTDYSYPTVNDFAQKDSLPSGDAGKVIKGSDFATEFTAIKDAIASKANTNSPVLTGTPTLQTSPAYTVNNSQIATTEFVYDLIESGATGTNGQSVLVVPLFKSASSLPTTPIGGSYNFSTLTLTPPTGWSATAPTPAEGEVVYISYTTASTTVVGGTDSTLTWTAPAAFAQNGQDGTSSDTNSNSITVYYTQFSANAPTLTSGNFTDGAYNATTGLLTLPSGWIQNFNTPVAIEGGKLWAATVNIYTANDGTQTFTVYGPYNWIRFDGLVTFTNLEGQINSSTQINGGIITTDSIQVNKLTSGSSSFNNVTFGLGSGNSVAGYTAGGYFTASGATRMGVIGLNNGGGFAGGYSTVGSTAALFAANATSTAHNAFNTTASLAAGTIAGYFTDGTNIIELCNGTYAFQTSGGNFGTFTGGHDALLDTATVITEGDIVVDTEVVAKPNVFDAVTKVSPSSSASQKGVVGVYAKDAHENHTPTALAKEVTSSGGITSRVLDPQYDYLYPTHKNIVINSVGEGLVNVCGENGNIEIGDLIVSSSTTGKGMKQSDDIVRGCTVAKARETVTFNSPDEVQQIACIYLCG